ncbi:hypothetical protein B566_EDAN006731 [Ephemera danica]|nr:hypothetical protein B566_EDAN006731 [Ephemera danica]
MSEDKNCTPNIPTSLTSPLKNGDNTINNPKRPIDYSSFRSPSKSDYTPPKSFQPSPSSKGLYSKDQFQDSPRFHQSGGVIPKSGILSTCDTSSPTSRLRRSTSDLPTMPDGSRMDLSMQGNNQRQRSLTGEIILSGFEARENHSAGGETVQRNHDQAPKPPSAYRNPEQPEYDTESQLHGTPKETAKPKEADKTPQPYIGENQNLPFVCGDNIGSIPDLGFGLREFLASLKPSHPQSRKTPTEPVHEDPCVKKNFYSLGGEASTSTGFSVPRRQLNFDEHGEVLPVSSQDDKLNMSAVKRPSAFVPVGSGDTRIIGEHQTASLHSEMSRPELTGSTATRSPSAVLPSLTQLWHDGGETLPKTPTSGSSLLHQKLEEEKYRRLNKYNTIAL